MCVWCKWQIWPRSHRNFGPGVCGLYENQEFSRLSLDIIAERLELVKAGNFELHSTGWPTLWYYEEKDRDAFLQQVQRFTGNHGPQFGRLLTPLVNVTRVRGSFQPVHVDLQDDDRRLVLLDGEGLGHSAREATSASTKVMERFPEVDMILLVDNGQPPMQAAPLELLRSVGSSGHGAKLAILFTHLDQVQELCQHAGLVKLGHVALDGTKIRSNASKHKAMSYGRMKEREEQLQPEMDELLRQAQEVDEEEDRRYGRDKRGDALPEELSFQESRLRKIREARAALEAEALAEAEQAEGEGRNHPRVPDDKAQRNFTDPDSRIMPGPGGRNFQQSYNCQAVVDSAQQVIVAARATNQPSDKQQAVVMVEEAIGNVGTVPREVSADAGYYSAKAVEELYALGVDSFVAPEKTRHGRVLETAPRGRIPQGLSVRDRMRRKLRTKRGRERYALRMETVEPVFGQIKQGRGFRQFLLRGLAKVNREWLLICTGHNLLKLFRFGEGKTGKARATGPAGNNRDWHRTATRGIFQLPPAYACPPRTRAVAVGWFHLNPCQSAIPRTCC